MFDVVKQLNGTISYNFRERNLNFWTFEDIITLICSLHNPDKVQTHLYNWHIDARLLSLLHTV
jgi:hypothetical protein